MSDAQEFDLVDVTIDYLEMDVPPDRPWEPFPPDLCVERIANPTVAFYRPLYDAIGKDYRWLSRRRMSDADLQRLLSSPGVEMHVLHDGGNPAGFVELDRRVPDEIEIVQFGLLPQFHGRGLGRRFLDWVLAYAWAQQPRRVWLHTCSLDHPAALPLYRKAGFREFRREHVRREY